MKSKIISSIGYSFIGLSLTVATTKLIIHEPNLPENAPVDIIYSNYPEPVPEQHENHLHYNTTKLNINETFTSPTIPYNTDKFKLIYSPIEVSF